MLEEYTQESGGIHMPGGRIPTYETCIALVCLKEANRRGRYNKIIKAAAETKTGIRHLKELRQTLEEVFLEALEETSVMET